MLLFKTFSIRRLFILKLFYYFLNLVNLYVLSRCVFTRILLSTHAQYFSIKDAIVAPLAMPSMRILAIVSGIE